LFGEALGCVSGNTPAHGEGFLEAFHAGYRGFGIRIVLGPLRFLVPNKKWNEAIVTSHRFADHYIDKALQYREKFLAGEIDTSFIGDKQSGTVLYNIAEKTGDRIFLRSQVLQALMASQDTTSNLIGNVFFLLSRRPDIWQKVRQEVLLADDDLDFNRLMGMTYLQKVIAEGKGPLHHILAHINPNLVLVALRIYPVFPNLGRTALRDTILPVGGGLEGRSPIFVPKGTRFDTSFYTLHHDPDIWGPDAEEFNPDRWDTIKPNAWEYVPFGGGMRTCLGQQKATLETSYVVARMMQEFQKIESRDDRPWQGYTALTARNANGCLVSLTPA
jgi:cytochrome P450